MRQSLKISLSLLISLIVCSVFSILAFTRLFTLLETAFFQPRLVNQQEQRLDELSEQIERHHLRNLERFQPLTEKRYTATAFLRDQSQQDIVDRTNTFDKLLEDYRFLQQVRLIGPEGKKIHFSTSLTDSEDKQKFSREYLPLNDVDSAIAAENLSANAVQNFRLIFDEPGQRIVYAFPVVDTVQGTDIRRGTALFYFSKNDLLAVLQQYAGIGIRDIVLLARGSVQGVLINPPETSDGSLSQIIVEEWQQIPTTEKNTVNSPVVFKRDEEERRYQQFSISSSNGFVGTLLSQSDFELQTFMRVVLLSSVFLTVFVVVFLVFNFRRDPELIVAQRIRRVQYELLQEILDDKEGIDWNRWRLGLTTNRSELKKRVRQGIGRVSADKLEQIDSMVDRSWNEMAALFEARMSPAQDKVDLSQIEGLIQRALDKGKITVSEGPTKDTSEIQASPQVVTEIERPMEVEEIGVDEVQDFDSAEPSVPLAEAEAVEDLEEVAEAEAVEDLEEVAEAEAVEDLEEVGEAEAVEDLEEVGEAEAVEDLEEVTEADAVEESAVTVPEGEIRELMESAEIAEIEEASEAEAPPEGSELAKPQESLEELAAISEITPLPPEPQEELEELPTTEESGEVESVLAAEESRLGETVEEAPTEAVEIEELEELEEVEAVETLEVPEEAPTEAVEIEELEELEEVEAVETLEVPEETDAALTELEEVGAQESEAEPVSSAVATVMEAGELGLQESRLNELVESGKIVLLSIKEIQQIIDEQRSSVVMENGVYRIKEEILAQPAAKAGGLMALAEAFRRQNIVDMPVSDIGDLLGIGASIDLAQEIGHIAPDAAPAHDFFDQRKTKKIQFYEDGLDYDDYLNQFGAVQSEMDDLRSLIELSRKIKAVSAAICSFEEDRYVLKLTVGLRATEEKLFFAKGELFFERYLKDRKTVIIKMRVDEIDALKSKFDQEDLHYMQGALFMPAVFRGKPSVLFLGLSGEKEMDIYDITTALSIY